VATTEELIVGAVERVREEVPAFTNLKLVLALEVTAGGLMGPAKSDTYRIEVPGPKVAAADPDDARLRLSIPKPMFDVLAAEGALADWKDAFYYGHLKVDGDPRVKRLLGKAIDAV
jgi:hypothetical protein